MDSSPSTNSSSFGSTASSSSPANHVPTPRNDAEDAIDRVAIKQEPLADAPLSSDNYDRSDWAHIFDDTGAICLDVDDDDYPMDEEDRAADPRRCVTPEDGQSSATDALFQTTHDPTPSSALLEHWSCYEDDVTSLSHANTSDVSRAFAGTTPTAADAMTPSTPAAPALEAASTQRLESTWVKPEKTGAERPGGYDCITATPLLTVTLDRQAHGPPFALSKPIVRDDGLLIVGTEVTADARANRLFVTNARASSKLHSIATDADVRDLHWLGHSTAIAAIGRDMHLVLLGRGSTDADAPSGSLAAPLRRVHADTIRELAVNTYTDYGSRHVSIASGGFDETVVLTTLGESGDTVTATIDGKIDACDVVSSVRWHPTQQGTLSWTTDGGDFQVADIRARAKPQLQVPLGSILEIDAMGGLFSHEYISTSNVVLGFQSGQLLFVDLRMPRKQCCYGVLQSPLTSIGELRRSASGTIAMFGIGGFATATADALGRELATLTGARPPHSAAVSYTDYKTSGAFSSESGSIFAVSDNVGVVSVYATDASTTSAGAAPSTPRTV